MQCFLKNFPFPLPCYFDCPEKNEWFCMFTTWKTDHFLQNVFSFPKPWQHCALPSSGKNTVSHCFFVQASAPSWLASALPGWKFCFSPQMILIYTTCILFFKPNSHWYSKEFNMSAEFRFNRLDSASLVYRKEFQYPNYISFWDSNCTCAPVSINRDNIFAPFRFFIESKLLPTGKFATHIRK